jgi:molybdenum cofactor cytidylyltransferase
VAVLAAGRGERLGGTTAKPLAVLAGRPLVDHALAAAAGSGLRPVVLVVGHSADAVAERAETAAPAEVRVVHNDAWRGGIATSLHAAIRALDADREVEALVVGLADQPLVGSEAYRRVAASYDDGAVLAAATYEGRRANPVLVARSLWPEALRLAGDAGARQLMDRHQVVEVPCEGLGDPTDADTPSDLAALERILESRCRSETASE